MLQTIRSKASSIVVKILFLLLIASFAVWGIADVFRTGIGPNTVATVGDTTISMQDLDRQFRREVNQLRPMFGGTLTREQALQFGLGDRALRSLVTQSLLKEEADRLHLGTSDDLVRQEIIKQQAFRNPLGQFDRRLFEAALAANDMTEAQYVAGMRRDLLQRQLIGALTVGLTAPASLTDTLSTYRNEQRVATVALISRDTVAAPAAPTDAEIEAYYKENTKQFEVSEYRAVTYVWIQPKDLSNEVHVSDDELKAIFEQRKAEFEKTEVRTLAQARFADRTQAERTRDLMKTKNLKLEEAAKEITSDKNPLIVLENVAAKDVPIEALGKVGFALEQNKISDPIETPLGWYLVEVRSITPAIKANFDDAKQVLHDEVVQERSYDAVIELTNKLEDATLGGRKISEAAAELNIPVHKIEAVDRYGSTPSGAAAAGSLPPPTRFLPVVFGLSLGQTSPLSEAGDGSYFMVEVDGITPPSIAPLEKVKSDVRNALLNERRAKAVQALAKEISDKVKSGGNFTALAKEKRLTVSTSEPFDRTGAGPKAPLPAAIVAELFAGPVGTVASAAGNSDGRWVIAKLESIKPYSATANADMKKAAADEMLRAIQADIFTQYNNALTAIHKPKVDRQAATRVFAPTSQQ